MIARPCGDGQVVIDFDQKEFKILLGYYGTNLGIATALSKPLRTWIDSLVRASHEQEKQKLYDRFSKLSSDEQRSIINIIERREQIESRN